MRIKLNLLPKSKEKIIKNNKILKFIVLQEIMIIITTLFFFVAIKGVDAIAKYQLRGVDQQLAIKGSSGDYVEIKKYEEGLKEARLKVDFIKDIQKFNVNWSLIFNRLAILTPQEVIIESIEGIGLNLVLQGTAQDRDTLIRMKENIQKDDCFENVNIPLNDIVLRENIEFELALDINIKCLNSYEKK